MLFFFIIIDDIKIKNEIIKDIIKENNLFLYIFSFKINFEKR